MNYYNEIKETLIKNEIYKKVKDYSKNKSDLNAYFEVGRLIVEAQGGEKRAKYGNKLIKEYSAKLTNELGKGYTTSALKRMRKFYVVIQKGATMSHQSILENMDDFLKELGIGVIICKKENKFVMEYCTNPKLFTTTYKTS